MGRARQTALIILKEVNEDGKYANISLKEHLIKNQPNDRDAAFITQLVYGTLENQSTIDIILRKFAKTENANPWVRNILRMGAYQILYLDRVPDSAACNESVKLCARFGPNSLRGFVNGVLRNVTRNKHSLNDLEKKASDADALSSLYGFPPWLIKMWIEEYGEERAKGIVRSTMDPGWLTIRLNRRKTCRQELIGNLEQQGIKVCKSSYFENVLRIQGAGNISTNPLYKNGIFTVQGESSMLSCEILDPKPGEQILDACSAPGGKAIYMAELMDMKGRIFALDIHEHRLELIKRNKERMNVSIIETRMQDATIFNPEMDKNMDRVLLDVPCSGWGLIHKKPDIKLRIKKDNMESLCRLQWKILKNCSRYVKPGGILVYSTCTINPLENNRMVERFIGEHPEFTLEDLDHDLLCKFKDAIIGDGMIQLFPNEQGIDGFFIAKMRRITL